MTNCVIHYVGIFISRQSLEIDRKLVYLAQSWRVLSGTLQFRAHLGLLR